MEDTWAIELILVFGVVLLLWLLLRWRKRTRFSLNKCKKLGVALTSQGNNADTPMIPPRLAATTIKPGQGYSAEGFYGYPASYLSDMLENSLQMPEKAKDVDYMRGLSVYSMSAVINIGKLATGAYAYPKVPGWEEYTENKVLVRSLSWDWMNESAPDVVKIVLTQTKMKDQRNSARLQFSISWSTKFSEDFTHASHDIPLTFLISRRTSSIMKQDVSNLCAKVTYKTVFGKQGTIEFPPKPLKGIGPAGKQEEWTSKDGSITLEVTLSTVKFSEIRTKSSVHDCCWDTSIPVYERVNWFVASRIARLDDLNFKSCVYIDNEVTSTQCWIFRLVDTKTVAIAFRGTQTDRAYDTCVDGLRDITCLEMTYDFGPDDPCTLHLNDAIDKLHLRVHRGFFTGYLSVREIVLETVYQMTEQWNSDWSIVVTGHSLGASLAILCGVELANRTLKDQRPNVSTMLLAPVRTGTAKFVKFYIESIPCSYRVVNQIDCIGTICMGAFYDHVPFELQFLDDQERIVHLPDSSDKEKQINCEIRTQIKKSWKERLTTLARFPIPEWLRDHLPGQYLFSTWIVVNELHDFYPPPSAALKEVEVDKL